MAQEKKNKICFQLAILELPRSRRVGVHTQLLPKCCLAVVISCWLQCRGVAVHEALRVNFYCTSTEVKSIVKGLN